MKDNALNTKITSLVVEIGGQEIFCTHDPADINVGYKINLVGHVHDEWKVTKVGKKKLATYVVNVGVDAWNFYPLKIEEILREVEKFKEMKK